MLLKITSFEIPSTFTFVRGYEDELEVNVTVVNMDTTYDVVRAELPDNNFNLTIYFADAPPAKRRRRAIITTEPYVVSLSQEESTSGLLRDDAINMLGTVSTNVPRPTCTDITVVCAQLLPATGSSYSLPGGHDHIKCLDIQGQLPCLGMSLTHCW